MIHGISEYEKYKLLRPLYSNHKYELNGIPIIKKEEFNKREFNNIKLCNFKNIKSSKYKDKSLVIMFNYDNVINKIWEDPFKYLPKLLGFMAISTPDYSVYPNMNINDIQYNVYKNRWIGCMLQEKGFKVIPTIQWALEDTYDICFSGVEKHSIVIISTIGCLNNQEVFIKGFNEMKKRIEPPLVIVFGKMIKGMTGTFLQFDYTEGFAKKDKGYIQLSLFPIDNIFTIEGGDGNGE